MSATYFAINSFFIAVAVSYEKSSSPIEIWKQNFAWVGLNYVGGASVAMLLVTYRQSIDLTAVSVILPILAITYLTFRTSLGRLADANRHVTQVNDLYLSTIETLGYGGRRKRPNHSWPHPTSAGIRGRTREKARRY